MKLEEAIETYTSNAEYERTHGNLQGCLEFRQLAKWLKDYKGLLKAINAIKKICATYDIKSSGIHGGLELALNIIYKHMERSQND